MFAASCRVGRFLLPIGGALFLVLLPVAATWACPGCKDAVAANDPQRANVARGYYWSIIFMFSMPYLILGTVGSYFYLEIRRARANKARLAERDAGAGQRPDGASASVR